MTQGICPCGWCGEVTKSLGPIACVRLACVPQERDALMRRSNLRFGFAAMLVGLCAWAVTFGERHLAAQPVPGKGKDKDKDKDKEKDNEKDVQRITDDWAFGPPLAKDPARQLEAARQYLEFKEVPWPTVCELLQRILDSKSDSFIEVPENGVVNSSYLVSVKTEANRIISSF